MFARYHTSNYTSGLRPPASGLRPPASGLRPILAILTLFCIVLFTASGTVKADTLGIDCDKPRYTTGGKLILDFDNVYRTKCETDRATALNYAQVVSSTRDTLQKVFRSVPQPLWDHLVKHLHETDSDARDTIHDWVFPADNTDLALINGMANSEPAALIKHNANYWQPGIMDKTSVNNVWHSLVQARACGMTWNTDSDRPEIDPFFGTVLIWLDPGNIRDRWTAQMIQHTVRAHMEGEDGYGAKSERIPDLLTDNRKLVDAQGQENVNSFVLRTCLDKEPAIPSGSLIMQIPLRYLTEVESKSISCTNSSYKVGSMTLESARHNGINIVPMNAIRPDGTPHPQRGKPLMREFTNPVDRPVRVKQVFDENGEITSNSPLVLDPVPLNAPLSYPNLINSRPLFLTKACREPDVRDYVQTQSCDSTINGNPVKGSVIRTYRFREFQDDPTDLNRVYLKAVKRDPGNAENPLGVPLADDDAAHPLWNETTLFCPDVPDPELPTISEPVVITEGVKTCKEQWGASYEGTRTGYVRKVVYPEGWPVRQTESKYVDDDCFLPVPNRGIQNGTDACQEGYEGIISKNRELSWFNRLWAVTDNHYPTFDRRMPLTANIHDAVFWSGIDQSPLMWYDKVAAGSWNITSNSCQIICSDGHERVVVTSDTGTSEEICRKICPAGYKRVLVHVFKAGEKWDLLNPGSTPTKEVCQRIYSNSGSGNDDSSEGEGSYDTDGDGITDSRSPGENGGGYSTGGVGSQADQSGSRGGDENDDGDNN